MKTPAIQITIRGLDIQTKTALAKRAAQRGMSLNKYSLATLRQAAGTDTPKNRFEHLVAIIDKYSIPAEDIRAANEAISWMDKASKAKQKRDERELDT